MASIALLPCCFTNGAATVGELSAILKLSVYTDDMFLADLAGFSTLSPNALKSRLFGQKYPGSLEIVETEELLNWAATQLALDLAYSGGKLFFGFHAALFSCNPRHLLRVQIVGSRAGRIRRGMCLEGIGAEKAARLVARHDRRAEILSRLVHGRDAYQQELVDLTLDCDSQAHSVIIDTICTRFQLLVEQPARRRKVVVARCVGADLIKPHSWRPGKPGGASSSPYSLGKTAKNAVGPDEQNSTVLLSCQTYLESASASGSSPC